MAVLGQPTVCPAASLAEAAPLDSHDPTRRPGRIYPASIFDVNTVGRGLRLRLGPSEFAVVAQQIFGYQYRPENTQRELIEDLMPIRFPMTPANLAGFVRTGEWSGYFWYYFTSSGSGVAGNFN